jgi:hypothetical protein
MSFKSEHADPRPAIVAVDVESLRMRDIDADGQGETMVLLESVKKLSSDLELEPKITQK